MMLLLLGDDNDDIAVATDGRTMLEILAILAKGLEDWLGMRIFFFFVFFFSFFDTNFPSL